MSLLGFLVCCRAGSKWESSSGSSSATIASFAEDDAEPELMIQTAQGLTARHHNPAPLACPLCFVDGSRPAASE